MMKIEVFGTGCSSCRKLEKTVKKAISEMKIKQRVIKVEDLSEIASRGIPITPALVVNGDLVAAGRVPNIDEIKEILEEYL